MAKVVLGSAKSGVVLSDDLSGYVRDVVDRLVPGTRQQLEEAAEKIATGAAAAWPVGRDRGRRPHSAELFETGLRIDKDGTVAAFVRNTADYAFYVRSSQVGSGSAKKHAWTEIVRKPAQAQASALAAELGDLFATVAKGGK
ncbi:MAG: hypothetical protein H6733_10220 [Alphaproteobacteria bacterium]|nr:hypothetical protein [Alphaproteobacteria bacterium]